MATTVLKQGTDPHSKYICLCKECGTIYTYEWEDIDPTMVSSWHEYHHECPVCHHHNGFSNKRIEELDYIVDGTRLDRFEIPMQIPSGINAYALLQNGPTIEMMKLDIIIPADIPVLLVGSCNKISTAPGIIITSDYKAPYLKIEKVDAFKGYLTILRSGAEFELHPTDNKEEYGIPTQVVMNTTSISLDNQNDPYEYYEEVNDVSELDPETAANTSIKISNADVINQYGNENPYFKDVAVTDCEINETITLKALDSIEFNDVVLAGSQGATNGKVTFASKELTIKNITADPNSTLYNMFEGYQATNDPNYDGVHKILVEDVDINCPSLTHNILNVYTPADDAKIIFRNCKFNLTVDNSNILRLANYLNSKNVEILFDNVEWSYENSISTDYWEYAGLVIYQPASSDVALNGDYSNISTWKFIFKNCKYNGVKITENNFGEHNQAFYMYGLNNVKEVIDPVSVEGLNIEFK